MFGTGSTRVSTWAEVRFGDAGGPKELIDALICPLDSDTSEDAPTFSLKLLLGVGEAMEEVWVKTYISGVHLLDGQGFNCQFWGSLPSDLMVDHPELADLRFFRGTYNNFPTSRAPRGQLVRDRSR